MNKTSLDSNFIFFSNIKLGKLANISFCDRITSVSTDELNNKSYREISNFTNAPSVAYSMTSELKLQTNTMF